MTLLNIAHLSPFDGDSDLINAIVETPSGKRTKFKYDEKSGLFQFDKRMPAGFTFPFDFGFIPSTLGEDGDPLDVMILTDEPTFAGCIVLARLLGVLEAEQSDKNKTFRNDRLIAVPVSVKRHEPQGAATELDDKLMTDIRVFFIAYNEAQGKKFKPLGIHGPDRAARLIREGMTRAQNKK